MKSVQEAIVYGVKRLGYREIKDNQRQVVEAYLAGRDVFVVSPTGSGKSLCFQIAPFIFDFIRNGERENVNSVCLVIVPLVSLMRDQLAKLQTKGFAAGCLGADSTKEEIEAISNSKCNVVFGSPEALLNSHRNTIRKLKAVIDVVFIDESHCVAKWGQGSANEEAFRADYGRLAELRSILRNKVPFVALTATATEAVRKTIIRELSMSDCVQILTLPDKPNTMFSVSTINQDDLYKTFSWLITELETKQRSAAKVLVFCRKRAHVKELYELFKQMLGLKAYVCPTGKEPRDDRTRLFAMYHRKTHHLVKEVVEREICKTDGSVRVVFCTIAFGMGVDVKGANLVLHLGPSGGVDNYVQECGRVGRDSTEMSHAVLLCYKGCLKSKNISKEMKEYVKNGDTCRRLLLMKQFSPDAQKGTVAHACCDICATNCKCLCTCAKDDCTCVTRCNNTDYMHQISVHLAEVNASSNSGGTAACEVKVSVSEETRKEIRDSLLVFRSDLAKNVPHEKLLTGLDLATGFSRKLIDNIVSNLNYIDSLATLLEKFNFMDTEHASETWNIISDAVAAYDGSSSENEEEVSNESNTSESNSEAESDDSDIARYRHKKVRLQSSTEEDSDF